jgi:uncharacterized protein YbbK (DUF523 family)
MQLVLVSSCLLGIPVRYNGTAKRSGNHILQRWLDEGRVVPVCPEVAAGLPVPRPPAEILGGAGGAKVLAGLAKVVDAETNDVTAAFVAGAEHTLRQAQLSGAKVAVLKEGSPSCGSGYIYDGTFTGKRVPEHGVTATLLENAGIKVFSEERFAEANAFLRKLEAHSAA